MDQVRRKTNATSAYQRHLTGKGVTVAFLDTGISMHPDLQGRIRPIQRMQKKRPGKAQSRALQVFPQADTYVH